MKRVDTTYWKVFRVGEFFDIIGGKGITKNEIFEHQGALPAIQSGEENFGCIGYIDKDYCLKQKYTISKGECLTVARSGSSGYVGYQASQCVVGDSAKILEPKFEANTLRLLFLRSALMVNKVKYAYTDKVTNENYAKDIIKLPSTPDGDPDWEYMENYMRKLEQRTQNTISAFVSSKCTPQKIDTTYWKEFYVGKFFDFQRGKVKKLQSLEKGTTPVIAAARSQQGIAGYYDVEPVYRNQITISCNGVGCGSSFYHDYPFNVNGDAIVSIDKMFISEKAKLFICCILDGVLTSKYSYEEKCSPEKATKEKILLPATPAGEPDWHYMEMYMRGVEAMTKEKISLLTKKKQEPVQQTNLVNYGTVNIYEK